MLTRFLIPDTLGTMQKATTLPQLLSQRRSCRSFLPRPIPRAELEEMLAPALRAPSNCNTQPWFFHIVTCWSGFDGA